MAENMTEFLLPLTHFFYSPLIASPFPIISHLLTVPLQSTIKSKDSLK